jgi:hypothetical protein
MTFFDRFRFLKLKSNPKILIINRLEGLKPSKRYWYSAIYAKNAGEPNFKALFKILFHCLNGLNICLQFDTIYFFQDIA